MLGSCRHSLSWFIIVSNIIDVTITELGIRVSKRKNNKSLKGRVFSDTYSEFILKRIWMKDFPLPRKCGS